MANTAHPDGRGIGGLDADQWNAVFGLVLDELRASAERVGELSPGSAGLAGSDDGADRIDEPRDGSLICEDGR
jgi:hypothetical protein